MDNAGENLKLEARMNGANWKLDIEPEYTAVNTPQQNHLAELSFHIIANRGRALMHRANVPLNYRYELFREAFATITQLDWLAVIEIDGVNKTRYKHWSQSDNDPKFAKHLRTWGEAGTVKTRKVTTSKLEDRGTTCMLVGYALNHDAGVYRMFNPETDRVIISRDIIWLRRMFFEQQQGPQNIIVGPTFTNEVWEGVGNEESNEPSVDETVANNENEENEIESIDNEQNGESDDESYGEHEDSVAEEDESISTGSDTGNITTTRSGRTVKPPSRLIEEIGNSSIYNEIANVTNAERNYLAQIIAMQEEKYQPKNEYVLMALIKDEEEYVIVGMGNNFQNTKELKVMKYDEAMATENKAHWDKAVEKEHDRMVPPNGKNSPIWVVVKRKDLPPGVKIMKTTWAMKLKPNGIFRARITARGYEQIDGIHFDGSSISAPVTNEFTVKIILVLGLMADWDFDLIDIHGAFLLGLFEDNEEIYIEVPQGFEKKYIHYGDVVLKLVRTIYGTKQAAMAYWREQCIAMRDMNYDRSSCDPCLNYKWTDNGLTVWLSWVDDNFSGGKKEDVKQAINDMSDRFDCEYLGAMKEYLGCKIDHNKKDGSIKITQPVMLQSFEDEFEINKNKKRITPAEPGSVLAPAEERNFVNPKRQKYYRSGVGKLLHGTRWSRPEIQNAVRELFRSMKGAASEHRQEEVKKHHRTIAKKILSVIHPSCDWKN